MSPATAASPFSGAGPAGGGDTTTPGAARPSAGARLLLAVFRAYQVARTGRLSPCRFTPTCSEYAVQAVQTHGGRRGLGLTVRRLVRCRPGGPFGPDPVPERG